MRRSANQAEVINAVTKASARKAGRPSRRDAEAKQRAILDAATREFMERGYDRSSMDSIAAAADTTKQTIYRLYPAKDLLFRAVIEKALADGMSQLEDFHEDPRPPAVVLREVALHMRQAAIRSRIKSLRNVVMDVRQSLPKLQEELMELINQSTTAAQLGRYFEELNQRGVLQIERPMAAAFDFGLLVSPLPQFLGMQGSDFSEADRIDDVIGLFLRGYATTG